MLRVGCVSFINALPLIEGITDELIFDDPATLTRKIVNEELDIALLPVVDIFRYPQLKPFTSLMIGSNGPVQSIRLVSGKPITEIKTYRRDFQSRSSNTLNEIILRQFFKLDVREVDDEIADATLYIGDRALLVPKAAYDYDLGDLWTQWTKLPFIFATWVKRDGIDICGWDEKLLCAYQRGKSKIPALAEIAAQRIGISHAAALDYFSNAIKYEVGSDHEHGLRRFHAEISLIETLSPLSQSTLFPTKSALIR